MNDSGDFVKLREAAELDVRKIGTSEIGGKRPLGRVWIADVAVNGNGAWANVSGAPVPSTDEELNEQVLQNMRQAGDDLSTARPVWFQFAFPSQESARRFAEDVGVRGLLADVDGQGNDPLGDLPWDVNVKINMRPELTSITGYERDLGKIAGAHCGRGDGWYCERIVQQ